MFEIRVATLSDSELLARIGAETFYDTFAKDNTPADMAAYLAKSFSPEIQARELAEPDSFFLVAETAGDREAAGYARLVWSHAPDCVDATRPVEILRLYGCRPWIGKGAAAVLMQRSLDEAARGRADVVWLGVWEHNHRAQAFYRKWGFVEAGDHQFVLGTDVQRDVIMMRRL